MAYLEFEIPVRSWSAPQQEILMAKLLTVGFEGFVETGELIQAYIRDENYSPDLFNGLIDELGAMGLRLQYRYHITPDQNWNEEWEKRFVPVTVAGRLRIRAPFHDPSDDLPCTIVIEPKMSFGTGHHYTTRLMLESMMESELSGKRVLDMGCGTGVLGIYACMQGAERVLGIDNDQWAYENALENASRNNAGRMEIRLGDAGSLGEEVFDVILANITRRILERDIPGYADHLAPGGELLVSGFLTEDVQYVLNSAYQCRLDHRRTREEENWISLRFVKTHAQAVPL